jgi:hypothetical protein
LPYAWQSDLNSSPLHQHLFEFLTSFINIIRNDLRARKHRHKIRIPVPSRDEMKMYMLVNSRAGNSAKIRSKIEFPHGYVRRNEMTKLHFKNRNVLHNFRLAPQFMITQLELLAILKDNIDLLVLRRESLSSKTKSIAIPFAQ